jgi:hypothetical protein
MRQDARFNIVKAFVDFAALRENFFPKNVQSLLLSIQITDD